MKQLDQARLDNLIDQARKSERKRAHDCLHPEAEDPVQRMLVALEPDTCVSPHRHPGEDRWEMLTLLSGRLALLLFDDSGRLIQRAELSMDGTRIVEFDGARWHALVALESGTLMLEVKRGPYAPLGDEDFASWAPREQDADAAGMRERFRAARVGERFA